MTLTAFALLPVSAKGHNYQLHPVSTSFIKGHNSICSPLNLSSSNSHFLWDFFIPSKLANTWKYARCLHSVAWLCHDSGGRVGRARKTKIKPNPSNLTRNKHKASPTLSVHSECSPNFYVKTHISVEVKRYYRLGTSTKEYSHSSTIL